jgi:hypothetical protein
MTRHRGELAEAAVVGGIVRILRANLEHDPLHGIPLVVGSIDVGENLILLQLIADWSPAGFCILRLRDVTSVRRGPNELFGERVLEAEGLRACIGRPVPDVSVTSWRTVFETLKQSTRMPLIHAEDESEATMYVGPIVEVGPHSLYLRYVNAQGVAEVDATEVPFVSVTHVEFDDPYSTILARHVRW